MIARFVFPVAMRSALIALIGGFAMPAVAQDQGDEAKEDDSKLEEIVVYARKRAENLQDVPIAITAFSAAEIEAAGLRNATDVASLTPGFNMASLFSGDGSTPVIRGLSTTIGEANVGFFVDGVYVGARQTMTNLLGNFIERIEVAKGPQSALYGRNSFGGAINYVTRRPGDTAEGELELTVGSDGKLAARVTLGGPLDENWSYRLAASHDEFDGYYRNSVTGGSLDDNEDNGFLAALLWTGEDVDIAFNYLHDEYESGDSPVNFLENNDVFFSAFGFLPPDFQLFSGEVPGITEGYGVTPGGVDRTQKFASLNVGWDLGVATLTSITGVNRFDHQRRTDDDYEAREIHFASTDTEVDEISQELRLTSNEEGSVRWMAGVYAYSQDDDIDINSAYAGGLLPILGGTGTVTQQHTEDRAVFGSLGFDVSETLALTVSARYGKEKKKVTAVDTDLVSAASARFVDKGDWTAFLPRVALDWQFSDDHMLYVSYSKSEKSGGFNVVTATGAILPEERTYDPESSDNYEIGLKSTLADGRVQTSVAAYYIRWEDQIVRALGATGAVLNANAGQTTSKGLELEVLAKASDKLDLRLGFAYNKSVYDEYFFAALAGLGANPVLDGNTLQYAPELTANLSATYTQPLEGGWEWSTRLDWDYIDEQFIVQTDDAFVAASSRVNLRTGFDKDKWSFDFWVYNLLDEDAANIGVFIGNPANLFDLVTGQRSGFPIFNALVTGPQLRSYGMTAKYRF